MQNSENESFRDKNRHWSSCESMQLVRLATDVDLTTASQIYCSSLRDASWLSAVVRDRIYFSRDTDGEAIFVYVGESGEICEFVSVRTESSFIHHLYVDSRFRDLMWVAHCYSHWKAGCRNHGRSNASKPIA